MPRYGKIVTDHPNVTTLLPEEFLSRARAGALPRFDVVLTASSVEHSGLGRHAHATPTHTRARAPATRRAIPPRGTCPYLTCSYSPPDPWSTT